jgi:hypothetical protein
MSVGLLNRSYKDWPDANIALAIGYPATLLYCLYSSQYKLLIKLILNQCRYIVLVTILMIILNKFTLLKLALFTMINTK